MVDEMWLCFSETIAFALGSPMGLSQLAPKKNLENCAILCF